MDYKKFDYTLADSQATPVTPLSAEKFDFDAYAEYESIRLERCRKFWNAKSGVLVYRRMRVAEVFSYGCKNMEKSLQWQLGALQRSIEFKADIPNFLEPWYGIGTIASSFGADYIWNQNQAPAIRPVFKSVKDALDYRAVPVAETPIGKHTLEMIDYFLENTKGRLPTSLADIQSPLNVACSIVDMNSFFMDLFDNPYGVEKLLNQLADLLADFTHQQVRHIGESLVWPGHGFSSARCFEGFGMSDDNSLMLSNEQYLRFAVPALERSSRPFKGFVFHSCGNWSAKVETIKQIKGLRMVDGAFSAETDPSPNPPEPFAQAFAHTGVVVNARIVGDCDTIADTVRRLWKPGMKLIVVTCCQTPQEQARAYDCIHQICE